MAKAPRQEILGTPEHAPDAGRATPRQLKELREKFEVHQTVMKEKIPVYNATEEQLKNESAAVRTEEAQVTNIPAFYRQAA